MSPEKPSEQNHPLNKKVRKADWVLLPLLAILTVGVIVCSIELTARHLFQESKTTTLNCLVFNDPSTAVKARPNSVCSQKLFESTLTDYHFNSCGHRAGMECGPKPTGTYRIVLTGSSFAEGLWVPREQTFAGLLPGDLSRLTGRKVEVYNEGMQWGTPHSVDLRFDEVLAEKPDMILWTVTPWDVDNASITTPYVATIANGQTTQAPAASDAPAGKVAGIVRRITVAFQRKSIPQAFEDAWSRAVVMPFNETRTSFLLQHFLYKSQSQYLKHYLMQDESGAFLKAQPNENFQGNLKEFDTYAADIAAKAKAAGVPLVVVLLPQRAQAAMISMGEWPSGFDPYKLGEEIRQPVESDGAIYIDVLHGFRTIPNPEQYYFPVDGHIDAGAHAILSRLLAQRLASGVVPGLSSAAQTKPTLKDVK